MSTPMKNRSKAGMTIVEVLMAAIFSAILIAGLVSGVIFTNRLNYASAQRVAAFGLCKEWYELMNGGNYTNIAESAYPSETVRLTHMGGTGRLPLMGVRTCQIRELNDPAVASDPRRKMVTITVNWHFANRDYQETLNGVIYDKGKRQ